MNKNDQQFMAQKIRTIYKRILGARKKKYRAEILSLSDKIANA